MRQQEPLGIAASMSLEEFELLRRFDAFGYGFQFERSGHLQNGADHGRMVGSTGDFLHEGFVDLDDIDRNARQVAE